jgi:hypothetical protein
MIEQQRRGIPAARSDVHALSEEMLERRRRRNRESMRRRRAERAESDHTRQGHANDSSGANSSVPTDASTAMPPPTRRCAICRVRKSVEEVIRLLPSSRTRSGYVQVRLPYCGLC